MCRRLKRKRPKCAPVMMAGGVGVSHGWWILRVELSDPTQKEICSIASEWTNSVDWY